MALIKAQSDVKKTIRKQQASALQVSDEAQERLAAILADASSIVRFAGTEWEIRPLRFGTQYLVVNEVCKINKAERETYGDMINGLATQIPAVCHILTLILLNDKNKIYQNGDQNAGYSKLYRRTYDTIMWNANRDDLANILLEALQLVDVSFFIEALGMLQIFRANVTEKKRMRTKSQEQK